VDFGILNGVERKLTELNLLY